MTGTSTLRFSVQGGIIATIVVALLLALVALPVSSSPSRLRRQSSARYNINLLAVVDNTMYTRFKKWIDDSPTRTGTNIDAKLKEYVSLVVHQMNVRLNNTAGLPLLNLVQMKINENVLTAKVPSNGSMDVDNAIIIFRDWLQARQLSSKYDHAILFTGYSFGSQIYGGEYNGRAYIKEMCNTTGYSVSIAQDIGGFQSAQNAVHEIGHSLGAVHDGGNDSVSCRAEDHYVMSVSPEHNDKSQNLHHPWYFSTCSSAAILSSLRTFLSKSATCFQANAQPMAEFAATANMAAGQLYPADVQCEMMYGQGSRPCLGEQYPNLDQICTSMYCWLPDSDICYLHFAAEGTTCGNVQWCRSGRCVFSNNAPKISSKCLNGDSVHTKDGVGCAEYVSKRPRSCYVQDFRENVCCASCEAEAIRRNSPRCEFGDRVPQYCTNLKKDTDACVSKMSDCCATCGSIKHLLHWVSAPMFVVLSLGAAFNSWGRNFL